MSKERRDISQRKIRRIKRDQVDTEIEESSQLSSRIEKILTPNTKLYYSKVVFGIASGSLTGLGFIIFSIPPDLWIVFLISGLAACLGFVRFYLKISQEDIDLKRLLFSGTFTYVILFIVLCSLIWMIIGG